jgi:hypothetical protein
MARPSKAELQEQVQLLKEAEGIVEQLPEKIVLQDAAAIKHKLDSTAAEVWGTASQGTHLNHQQGTASTTGLSVCLLVSQ